MRPKRAIILHNPRLIKIRRNLRTLIEQSYLAELSKLSHQGDLYRNMRQNGEIGNYPCQGAKDIAERRSQLMQAYSQSILFCNTGSLCISEKERDVKKSIYDVKLERDMVWAPWLGGWICLDCYNNFCIQQYDFDVKKRNYDEEKRLLEFLRKHRALRR